MYPDKTNPDNNNQKNINFILILKMEKDVF